MGRAWEMMKAGRGESPAEKVTEPEAGEYEAPGLKLGEDLQGGKMGREAPYGDELIQGGGGRAIAAAAGGRALGPTMARMPDELDAGIFGDEVYLPGGTIETRGGPAVVKGLVHGPGGGYELRAVEELEKEMEAEEGQAWRDGIIDTVRALIDEYKVIGGDEGFRAAAEWLADQFEADLSAVDELWLRDIADKVDKRQRP